jgi:DNA-directed RNA polymerase subunit alpha
MHEFDTMEGILEDMSEIILNLKQVRLKAKQTYTGEPIKIEISGRDRVTAGDLEAGTSAFSVVNPDLVICHMAPTVVFKLAFVVGKGKGYIPSEQHPENEMREGFLPIDAVYAPIKKVGMEVQNTLHGDRTDFEMLTLTIQTDGTISPEEALQKAASNLTQHFSLLYKEDMLPQQEEEEKPVDKEVVRMKKLLGMSIDALGLKKRAVNTLQSKNIHKLWQLVGYDQKQLVFLPNLGKKSIVEIANTLQGLGLSLGMDVKRYGYYPENNPLFDTSALLEQEGVAEA